MHGAPRRTVHEWNAGRHKGVPYDACGGFGRDAKPATLRSRWGDTYEGYPVSVVLSPGFGARRQRT